MAKLLNREATIKTALVEIKALTVGGKQVTQSLFKQLEEEDLIDWETLQLRGIPWGRVNYHVGCDWVNGAHLHIVWQAGSELRRCLVRESLGAALARSPLRNRLERIERAAVVCHCLGRQPEMTHKDGSYSVRLSDLTIEIDALAYSAIERHRNYPLQPHYRERMIETLRPSGDWEDYSEGHWVEETLQARRKVASWKAQWGETYAMLTGLDQLFIAC